MKKKIQLCSKQALFKVAQSDFSTFFKLLEILIFDEKARIFLITHGKFPSWKVIRLEDINENVPGYGNHN